MENILVIVIVSVVSLWACWSFYRTLTGKNGCGCSGASCGSKNKCAELSHNNDEKLNLKN